MGEVALKEELRKHCSQFGHIESLVVKKTPHTDYSFAFLNYENEDSGIQAVKEYNRRWFRLADLEIGGKKIRIEFQSKDRRRKDRE